jgi:hypothetical protein
MTSSGTKPRPVALAWIPWAAFLAALLGAGCGQTDPDTTCATYACVNDAHLAGNAELSSDSALVDVKLCIDDFCHEGTIDRMASDAGDPCLTWGSRSRVCLAGASASSSVSVEVVSQFPDSDAPHDASMHLLLTDHDSGRTLLDETRSAVHEITREDNCHRCWQATATL